MKQIPFVDELARSARTLIAGLMEQWFGPGVKAHVLGPFSWADIGTLIFIALLLLLANGLIALVIYRKHKEADQKSAAKEWVHEFLTAVHKPIQVFIWICGLYVASDVCLLRLPYGESAAAIHDVFDGLFDVAWVAALLWLFIRLTHALEIRLSAWAATTPNKFDDVLVVLLARSLRVIVPVVGIIFALPMMRLPPAYATVISKGSSVLIICTVAWIFLQTVSLGEKAVMSRYNLKAADNLRARQMYTQVRFLARAGYVTIAVFSIASILMLFEEVRRLGTSILASAGVVGIVAGLAAQNTIGNLLAGFQLAISQPMRIDDVLIVEGEWGTVEEITFTYVVLHIWDDRRLVIPLSYFIQKPFQNWTRASAQLMGSVMVYADYSLPVNEVRTALKDIVESSKLWDKRFWNLQVSDTTEHTMQLRVLATAANSSQAWDLRCEIREKLIAYLQSHHPESLPRTRVDMKRPVVHVAAGHNGEDRQHPVQRS